MAMLFLVTSFLEFCSFLFNFNRDECDYISPLSPRTME